jgi:hypothetical protein
MDFTLASAPMSLEEDQPLLTMISAGLFMALILLAPAVVEATQHGCLAAWSYFAVNRLALSRAGEPPGERLPDPAFPHPPGRDPIDGRLSSPRLLADDWPYREGPDHA